MYFENQSNTSGQRVFGFANDYGVFSLHSFSDNATSYAAQNILNLTYNGNVGIGTTTPTEKLVVAGGGQSLTPTYGNNVVTDGTFSIAGLTDWILGSGWADGTGTATKNADGTGTLSQSLTGLTVGRTYKLTYTISSISGGSITAYLMTGSGASGTARSTPGTYTEYLYCSSATNPITFNPSVTGVRVVIDNVTLQLESASKYEFTQNGNVWSLKADSDWPSEVSLLRNGSLGTLHVAGIDGVSMYYVTSGGGLQMYSAAEATRTGSYWTRILDASSNVAKGWFEKLRVNTTSTDADMEINNATGGKLRLTYNDPDGSAATYSDLRVSSAGNLIISPSGGIVGIGTSTASSTLTVQATTGVSALNVVSSSGASMLYVAASGNVGIGTDNPIGTLNTQAATGWYNKDGSKPVWNMSYSGTTVMKFYFGALWDAYLDVPYNNNGDTWGGMHIKTKGIERLTITQSGKIGIGTTTPDAMLNIFGTTSTLLRVATSTNQNIFVIGADGNATFGGSITANNLLGGATNLTVDANGVIVRDPSDINLKENVAPLAGAMEKVLALQGVTFNWKDKTRFGTQEEIGFVAQQVQEVVPQLVSAGGSYLSLKYPNVTALLVEAFKEQYRLVSTDTLAMFGTTTATTTSYWMTTSTLANATSTETTTLIASSTAIDIIINRLATGFSIVREFFAEKVVAAIGIFDQLKTRVFETDVAKINTGMEIKDAVTGEIYCVRIVNGDWSKVKGVCNVAGAYESVTPTIVVPETTATEVPASSTSSTEVVETPTPIPPAEEIIAPVEVSVNEPVSLVETVVTETPPTE